MELKMESQDYYNASLGQHHLNITEHPLVVNCAGSFVSEKYFISDAVRNDYYMMYMLEGNLEMYPAGAKSSFEPGNFILYPPNTAFKYINSAGDNVCYLWLHITGYDAGRIISEAGIVGNEIHNIGLHNEITEYFKRLFYEFILRDDNFDAVCAAIVKQLLICVGRYIQNKSQAYRLLRSIEFIHKNYKQNLAVEALAKIEHISPAHYRTIFKKTMEMSPREYLTSHRLKLAQSLLDSNYGSISDVAAAVGYSDPFYFSRIFKKRTGISPHEYRLNL